MQIGLHALRHISTYDVAEPHLESLTEITGECSFLGIRTEDDQVIYVRQCHSPKAIRHSPWLGRAVPIEGTAIGAAISGHINACGYAFSRHTIEPDVTAVAAPIRRPDDTILAAISVTGPSYRISDDDIERFGRAVVGAAASISHELGSGIDEPAKGFAVR